MMYRLGLLSFFTLVLTCRPGLVPPDTPETPIGPSSGLTDSTYTFSTLGTVPEGELVTYRFAWGQGETTDWSNWLASGETATAQHTWDSAGFCFIRTQARNRNDALSLWSKALGFSVTAFLNDLPGVPRLHVEATEYFPGDTIEVWAKSIDPDEDSVSYRFSWGDGDTTEWTPFLRNGYYATARHRWRELGERDIRAQARDLPGARSAWSNPSRVTVRTPYPRRVVARFPVGPRPQGIAVLPGGDLLYVAQEYDSSVGVFRTTDFTQVARIPVGRYPSGIAVLPDGEHAYVTSRSSYDVSVIRTSDNTVVATIPVGSSPYGIGVLPNGHKAYVACRANSAVLVIDTESHQVVDTVQVARGPEVIAVLPNGRHVYVGCNYEEAIGVIETATDSVVALIETDREVYDIAAHPNSEYVYAAIYDTVVLVIRTSDNTVVDRVYWSEDYWPERLIVNPTGEFLYVSGYGQDRLFIVRTEDLSVAHELVLKKAGGFALEPDGSRVYMTHYRTDSITVLGY